MNALAPMIALGDQFIGVGGIGFHFMLLTCVTGVGVIALVASVIAYRRNARVKTYDWHHVAKREHLAGLLMILVPLLGFLALVWFGARPAVYDMSLPVAEDHTGYEARDDGSYVIWTTNGDEIVYVVDMNEHIATVTSVTHPVLVLNADEYSESSSYVAERLCGTGATMTLNGGNVECTSADDTVSDFRFKSIQVPRSPQTCETSGSCRTSTNNLNVYYANEED